MIEREVVFQPEVEAAIPTFRAEIRAGRDAADFLLGDIDRLYGDLAQGLAKAWVAGIHRPA